MKNFLSFSILILVVLNSFSQKPISYLINTSFGDVQVKLYPEKATKTVANFLKYVDQKLYDGTNFFHR